MQLGRSSLVGGHATPNCRGRISAQSERPGSARPSVSVTARHRTGKRNAAPVMSATSSPVIRTTQLSSRPMKPPVVPSQHERIRHWNSPGAFHTGNLDVRTSYLAQTATYFENTTKSFGLPRPRMPTNSSMAHTYSYLRQND
jgi:hypothetical protein